MARHRIAILGASGYTGAELVRLIATHPTMEVAALTAERKAGAAMAEVFPHLRHLELPRLVTVDEVDLRASTSSSAPCRTAPRRRSWRACPRG